MEEIRCERLSFCYPDREEDALREISFSLSAASFTVLCGRSGCGKSTLLRHLKASMTPYGDRRGRSSTAAPPSTGSTPAPPPAPSALCSRTPTPSW